MQNSNKNLHPKTTFPLSEEKRNFITDYLKKAGLSEERILQIHQAANHEKEKTAMDSLSFLEAQQKAKEAIRPLVGNVLGMDHASAEEIYRYGLNYIGIKTDQINLQGLKSLAEREADYRSPQRLLLAADHAAFSEEFNPEEILSAYVKNLNKSR